MEETKSTPATSLDTATSVIKDEKKIPCILVVGMAGAGKTSFVSKLVSTVNSTGRPYVINLDPACKETPYSVNIGII